MSDIEIPALDGPMTPDQEALVAQLSVEHIAAIDEAIIAFLSTTRHWRKVARVVAEWMSGPLHRPGIPDVFYSSRVRALVETGRVESKGDLRCMRFSEVRVLHAAND